MNFNFNDFLALGGRLRTFLWNNMENETGQKVNKFTPLFHKPDENF